MKKIFTFILVSAIGITMSAQTDATYKIVNPDFETNGAEGWTCENMVPQSNTSFEKKHGNVYMEKWTSKGGQVGDASLKQTVKNLPQGEYRLTVAAQNIQQGSTTAQTGAYIYARLTTNKVTVTAAGDYSIDFSNTSTNTAIGFVAKNATGNYLCCDNFRLTFLSTTAEQLASNIEKAKEQKNEKMNDKHAEALNTAITNLEDAISSGKEDLTGLALKMMDAYVEAQANTKAYTSFKSIISKAKLIVEKKMSKACSEALSKALKEGEEALETTDNDPVELTEALQNAYDAANKSITSYTNLDKAIANAEPLIDKTLNGAVAFEAVINASKAMYEGEEASNEEIEAQINAITKAQFEFKLANATPGIGTAPDVKFTNHHVLTGANEALMRADYVGSNILEKGVCWSTEHNPTVLDNRTTKSFSNNGTIIHIKGLEPATVYYLRPYIINKTYTVAYGDEVKIVTHPKGNCRGTWNEGAPDEAANTRCRNAINETIEYLNQWTGIMGFTLTGNYGTDTPTADCSYGGWMRIGPNAGNQAIGTVLHEVGHGVGVGTSDRYWDNNLHEYKWYGREANKIYSFLENKEADPYFSNFCMLGDGVHAWGNEASYDWFVNGADKDRHQEFQYIGGCCLLYGFFIDGLNPTTSYKNGISGYTYNFDDSKRYYIMCKDAERGLGEKILYQNGSTNVYWGTQLGQEEPIEDDAAWYIEYNAEKGQYMFKNAKSGKYLTHTDTSISLKTIAETKSPGTTEEFQLMPDRTNVTIEKGEQSITTHGYWFTWGGNKAMQSNTFSPTLGYGKVTSVAFDFKDTATKQQWILISEDELSQYNSKAVETSMRNIEVEDFRSNTTSAIYSISGAKIDKLHSGINIVRFDDGTTKKVFIK